MQAPELAALRAGDRRALAKAITLIESTRPEHQAAAQALLQAALPFTGNSLRIGISGSPGVGKSTFIEHFGQLVLAQGKRLAVLAVDPSSARSGGSILGDKTRMETLARDARAFIRPSPAGGHLGGVAHKTREAMLLCEAAGYDLILVETLGVGQSEFEVAGMVDFFLLLLLPQAGDELQGVKKGILELADVLLVNKADGASLSQAQATCAQYQSALRLLPNEHFWQPPVLCCSALENRQLDLVWQHICDYHAQAQENGYLQRKRAQQGRDWLHSLLQSIVQAQLQSHLREQLPALELQVAQGQTTPLAAAQALHALFVQKIQR